MEEERIKSALELAMERISAMPELTPAEMAAQKEKQYAPIGEALAGRYLKGLLTDSELQAELSKHKSEHARIIRHSLISAFCRNIRLEMSPESAERALAGLRCAAPENASAIEKLASGFHEAAGQFAQEVESRSAEIQSLALRTLGVSGNALRCNPDENSLWLEERERMRGVHEPSLEALRKELEAELS